MTFCFAVVVAVGCSPRCGSSLTPVLKAKIYGWTKTVKKEEGEEKNNKKTTDFLDWRRNKNESSVCLRLCPRNDFRFE